MDVRSLLVLERVKVTNANAIAGITYGFPCPTSFLGFVHALERELPIPPGALTGVAIVAHHHELCTHRDGHGQSTFALTRNPLTREEKTAPFVEEGRMHMVVSLIVSTTMGRYDLAEHFRLEDDTVEAAQRKFEAMVTRRLGSLRLAGGRIDGCARVAFEDLPEEHEDRLRRIRKIMRRLMPGFCLVDRTDILRAHHAELLQQDPKRELIDSWLDFYTITYRAAEIREAAHNGDSDGQVKWDLQSRPCKGWIVPLLLGFKALSPLYEPGEVGNVRDASVPCRFVEGVYGLGEWMSPHRVTYLEDVLWHHRVVNGEWYLSTQEQVR